MEAVYRQKDGTCLMLYDEGNQIYALIPGVARTTQWGRLCRDYHSCGTSVRWMDEIYVAYKNVAHELIFTRLFSGKRLTLADGNMFGDISDVKITELLGEKNGIYVFYRGTDANTGNDALCIISPLGEGKVQRLLQSKNRIEHYEIMQYGGMSYLIYKLKSEHKPRIFAVDVSRLGDISLTEYILCKEKTMEELMVRCKENDRNFQKAVREKQEDYEERLKEKTKDIEKRYKEQYKELARLSKNMQQEGRRWRELYYKSVTKN